MCRIKSVGININDYWKIWELIRWCWTFWRYPMKRLVLSYFLKKFILIWSQISRKVTMIFFPELLGSESSIWWALSPLVCGSHKKDALLSKGTWQASRSGKVMTLCCHLVLRRRSLIISTVSRLTKRSTSETGAVWLSCLFISSCWNS